MVPSRILDYLREHQVDFIQRSHPRAITAQEVAAAQHVSGYRLAKAVVLRVNGGFGMAVLPATERLDLERLKQQLGKKDVRLAHEEEFASLFPGCELGAEPPLGGLFGLPVYVDEDIAQDERIVFRGGTHTDTLEVDYQSFARLEKPEVVAEVGTPEYAAAEAEPLGVS